MNAAPQYIHTEGGEDLVVIPRSEYEALLNAAADADEDAADAAAYDQAKAEMELDRAQGRNPALPQNVSDLVRAGHSRLTAWRRSRNLTQQDLALKAGIAQSYLSQLENKQREGTAETLERLAKVLIVDVDQIS